MAVGDGTEFENKDTTAAGLLNTLTCLGTCRGAEPPSPRGRGWEARLNAARRANSCRLLDVVAAE